MQQAKKEAFTMEEVARMIGFSRNTVARIFENEPGLLVLERPEKMHGKRRYRSIRIPRIVYERVIRRLTTT